MYRVVARFIVASSACALNFAACGSVFSDELPPPAEQAVDFATHIQPIFARACFSCHGPEKQKSSFRLDRRTNAFRGGDFGVAIVPHKSAESPLIRYVAGLEDGMLMPPEKDGEPLTAVEIGQLRRWIDDGAIWPKTAADETPQQTWWSLLALKRPAVPQISPADEAACRNDIDRFVLTKLREHGLSPSPEASRRVLIRRLSFDLLGMPPSPEQIAEFENDPAPDAYERLVDRLLASPHYGERWARHWLDVVHFGESNGFGMDRPRMNAWPYRDYVISAFNSDKPYTRFVEEQLAADALYPDDGGLIPALGFAAAGPFNQSALVEQTDDTDCKRMALNLDRDDMVASVSSTFLSMTTHCARCHEHKFDPITQTDYYRLQAVFAGVGRFERPYESDPGTRERRFKLKELKRQLEKQPDANPPSEPERIELAQAQAAWEKSVAGQAAEWTLLGIDRVTGAPNTTFTRLDDGSYLAGGVAAETDTYVIEATLPIERLTAIRIEVLPHDSLPTKGPGRQDNGNLHLSEVKLGTLNPPNMEPTWIALQNASADFNQQDWAIPRAIDGNATTAWGIHPEVSKPHQAVIELKDPIVGAGSRVVIHLAQLHGTHHLIGRFRITGTAKPTPITVPQLPLELLATISKPEADRSDAERSALAQAFRLKFVSDQLAALPPPQKVWSIWGNFPQHRNYKPIPAPYTIHVLRRGDIKQPLAEVRPGGLACVSTLDPELKVPEASVESVRRAQLAHWITSPENMLTWRSVVNRVWHYHFGRGIVDSPNDFGRMGSLPTHPELLDYLATEFRDSGQSFKNLHRLIVTSATYRQVSTPRPEQTSIDSDNRFLWRMNRPRLDAEALRDALLTASGTLDPTMGGPSVMQFKFEDPNMEVTPRVDYTAFDPDSPASFRRGVYRFLIRNVNDPLLEAFDSVDPSLSTPRRNSTITSLQALSLWNNRFVLRQCEHLAARAERESMERDGQFTRIFEVLLSRKPSENELVTFREFATKNGLASVCRVLINSNEFLFVE